MNEIKALYKQLKDKVSGLDKYVTFGVLKFIEPGYLGSPRQKKDTEMLHGFVEFMQDLLDEFDSEPTTQGLIEMKEKVIQNLTPLITKIETHPNWGELIERDITKMQRVKNVRLFYSTKLLKEGNGVSLSLNNQIRYLYNFLVAVSNDLQEPNKEPELPPIADELTGIDIEKDIEKLVLISKTGIYDYIVKRNGWENQPNNAAILFAALFGIDLTTKVGKTFASNVRGLNSNPEKILMPKHVKKIKAELIKIGIDIN